MSSNDTVITNDSKQSFWMKKLGNFLCQRISGRVKRLIFLSSVFGLIENINAPSKDTIQKLNTVLKLAHNNDAVAFPIYIHSWLWSNCEPNRRVLIDNSEVSLSELLSDISEMDFQEEQTTVFNKLAKYLSNIAPEWIVYGPTQMIAKDLEVLFKKCSTHH